VDVFEKAIEVLNAGWTKGIRENKDGEFCALGALGMASWQDPWLFDVSGEGDVHLLAEIVLENFRDRVPDRFQLSHRSWWDGGMSIVALFNNHPDTTKEDVIAVFEKARAKSQEFVDAA
jgi:hypothetical protein